MTDTERLAHDAAIPLDLAALVVLAALRINVSVKLLRGERRFFPLVRARWRVTLSARDYGYSYSAIGRALNRDHSTVIHGERRARVVADG